MSSPHLPNHPHPTDADHRGPLGEPLTQVPLSAGSCGACGCGHAASPQATPAAHADTALPVADDGETLLLRVPAMDCPTEEGQIRKALERVPGIRRLVFDLPGRSLRVQAAPARWPEVVAALATAGFSAEALSQPVAPAEAARHRRRETVQLAAALLVAALAELAALLLPDTLAWRLAGMALAAAAIGLAGLAVFRKGWSALRRGELNINALMAVAVTGAFAIGEWPEAAMVMALYALAELMEARAVGRARDAIKGLLDLSPPQAELRQPDGRWQTVPAQAAGLGAVMRVRPGERIALDGQVLSGRSAVDQSPVTGESVPVDKGPGDLVYAGTVNQGGSLECEVTAPAGDTVLARILHAVEQAQGQRAPMQRAVDRFAAVYTPAVFVAALAVAVGGPLGFGLAWAAAIYKALVLLVIACPCALVLSTPVTVVSGLAAAARRGILIKGGVHLEAARKLRVVALDKTGTLTAGRPRLVHQQLLRPALPEAAVWASAAGLAARSDHPVAQAIAAGLAGPRSEVRAFQAEAGRGVQGEVDGRLVVLGNRRWLEERHQASPELEALMRAQADQGRTVSVLADESGPLALFAVADTLRPTAKPAVVELQALGLSTVMLTGDNATTARAIAAEAGVPEVQAGLLPEQKLQAVRQLAARGPVAMVGDGINDAPALAAAHLGVAMGGAGTHIAAEAADVVIMNDDLHRLPETIRLSRRTHAVLWQNIVLALCIKALFLGWALFGNATMWMAVFADMGASLLVVFNGLRLLKGVQRRD